MKVVPNHGRKNIVRALISILFFLNLTLITGSTYAQQLDESTYALQNRKYHLRHEFFVGGGALPLDAFEKGYSGNISYTYHINDAWGLELPQLCFITNKNTSLQDDLRSLFGVQATDRDSKKYIAALNFQFKPIYRKMMLFNHTILHGETFFIFGGGTFKFDSGQKPMADLGAGLRTYINNWSSVRMEVRDYLWFNKLSPKNELMFSIGLSFNLGS